MSPSELLKNLEISPPLEEEKNSQLSVSNKANTSIGLGQTNLRVIQNINSTIETQ
jgi:hypothetical protein